MKHIAIYDAHGHPVNLEAAALDSLEWLRMLQEDFPKKFPDWRWDADWRRLNRCIAALEQFAADTEQQHEDAGALPATMIELDRQPQPPAQHNNPPPMPFDEFLAGGWKEPQEPTT
jgi:hypothetical protein